MPDRILRQGILTSDAINRLSRDAEVFYRRLMSAVDDYGRFDARPEILLSQLYPLQLERTSLGDIRKWLLEVGIEVAVLYTVKGKPYVEMTKFDQRIRSKSKWPSPTEQDTNKLDSNSPPTADNCGTKKDSMHSPNTHTHTHTHTNTHTKGKSEGTNGGFERANTIEALALEACHVFTPDILHAPAEVKSNVADLIAAGHRPERLRQVFAWAKSPGEYRPGSPATLTNPAKFPGYAKTAANAPGDQGDQRRRKGRDAV